MDAYSFGGKQFRLTVLSPRYIDLFYKERKAAESTLIQLSYSSIGLFTLPVSQARMTLL